jgi:hypothetical protein
VIVTISQPRYLPFQGYFHRIDCSDQFILLDNVQFSRHDWENRNKVKTAQGPSWLTVPVTAKFGVSIPQVRIDNTIPWQERHWRTLEQSYPRALYFDLLAPLLRPIYENERWEDLTALNIAVTWLLARLLEIEPTVVRASELEVAGAGSELILNLCRAVEAETYLSGPEGRKYLDVAAFHEAGIKVLYQDFEPAVYPQLHGDFVPYLSAIDLLFNSGPDSAGFLRESQPRAVEALST